MKRMISCLLAVVLVLVPCLQVCAFETDTQVSADILSVDEVEPMEADETQDITQEVFQAEETFTQEVQVLSENEADSTVKGIPENLDNGEEILENSDNREEQSDIKEKISDSSLQTGVSRIEVSIISALVLERPVNFKVSITGQISGLEETEHVDLNESSVEETKVSDEPTQPTRVKAKFESLPAQTYTLKIEAGGFATYTQDIEITDSRIYRVTLTTDVLEGYSESSYGNPGVLRIGDVDRDGDIDEDDKNQIVSAVDVETSKDPVLANPEPTKTPEPVEEDDPDWFSEDLNRDGKIDLADLEYFAKGYQAEPIISKVETFIFPESVQAKKGDSTKVEGDWNDVLLGIGSGVKLSREDGENISSEKPVEVDFYLTEGHEKSAAIGGIVVTDDRENPITEAEIAIVYEDKDGEERMVNCVYHEGVQYLLEESSVNVERDKVSGAICVNLGSQVAVKKVTLTITGVKNNNLAQIAKVEFIGDMASRIPEPQMNIPTGLKVVPGSELFTVNWNPSLNVTGYEVWIAELVEDGSEGKTCVKQVIGTTLRVLSLGDAKSDAVKNGMEYKVKVQAVNGTWRSGYCSEVIAKPLATKKPDPPDNLTLKGQYKSVTASWKKMKNTDTYNLYWKKVDGDTDYTKVEGLTTTSYTITGLEDQTDYEVYVTGTNMLGESNPSLKRQVQTTDLNPAQMPKYKRINAAEDGQIGSHIKNATVTGGGAMIESSQDTANGTIWGTVDNDYMSYYRIASWDLGGYNKGNDGLIYEFDQPYKLQNIALQSASAESVDFTYADVQYWNEEGTKATCKISSFQKKQDANGKNYYWIKLAEPVTAAKIKIGLARYLSSAAYRLITVSEVYFYHYDSLEDDILDLYEDDLHTVLRSDVTQATIDELRTRLNTTDPVSKEEHPDKKILEVELNTAQDILNAKELNSPALIHRGITSRGEPNRGFSGLNAWQPLGITAAAGDKLIVFVGHSSLKTGDSTNLQIVATQYNSEWNGVSVYTSPALKIGRNEITIPSRQGGVAGCETGGALYAQYTGAAANDDYSVRVQGGAAVPVLDLYKVTDHNEKLQRAEKYVTELANYVSKMEESHEKLHKGSGNKAIDMAYSEPNCILGASEILLDNMMLSLPAQKLLAGAGSGTAAAQAEKIVTSMEAMEQMMKLFYQHKGLSNNATEQIDKFPRTHLNIRYQRMFAGAFMYASGNHIGIQYGSVAGLMGGNPIVLDENKKYKSGNYFGWGIAHEIGHCINQNQYEVAEITNNYFSLLAQAKDSNASVSRVSYDSVYMKVTSNTIGQSSNGSTQLGLYWQLRQAYDNGNNYVTYDDYNTQLSSLFFARVDTYARTPSKAPAPGNIALELGGGVDQCLMRLSCAAAEKNILEFFERWGKTPDAKTRTYAEQFDKETRAIYYVNDDARVYRNESGKSSVLGTEGKVEAVGDGTTAVKGNGSNANKVTITLDSKDIPKEDILGYEIVRCTTSNGDISELPVGFVFVKNPSENYTFTDTVTTMNNRVVNYKVTLIDKFLNRSQAKELEALKIEHEGDIDKTNWTVNFNNITAVEEKKVISANDESDIPCTPEEEDPIVKVKDNDENTTYKGKVANNAEVILEFNQPQTIVAFKYTMTEGTPIREYSFYIQEQNGSWTEAVSGTFDETVLSSEKNQKVYLPNANQTINNIGAYTTSAVKLVIKDPVGTEIAISELDVLGATGDNVDFRKDEEGGAAIGTLASDYAYGKDESQKIPQGSLVFTGSYKGNPAYNVVLLYDQNGNLVGEEGKEIHQVILADVPGEGKLEEVKDGTWVYWIEPENGELPSYVKDLKKVRAELYRVDDAQTLKGQRLVSDSLFQTMPESLSSITLSGGGNTVNN